MVPLPHSTGYTHLVHPQSLHCNESLALVEEFGFHRRIRHEYEDGDGNNDCEQSAEEKDDLVRVEQVGVDVAKPVGDEGTENVDQAQGRVPEGIAVGLFTSLVPHLNYCDEGRS
jgi:hypothetical protein